jgi:hypothetical protein
MCALSNIQVQFRQEESQKINLIDIDHPTPELEAPVRQPSPEPALSPTPSTTSIYSRPGSVNGNEWSSPAFMKRARTSYGSLFAGYDPFAEADGSVRGKGRKRTRLSSTWRYSSRSPTPEPVETPVRSSPEPEPVPSSASVPVMTDEGCQTIDQELGDAAEMLANLSRQATASGGILEINGVAHAKVQEVESAPAPDEEVLNNPMLPPIMQTQFDSPSTFPPTPSKLSEPEATPVVSQSPRLRPLPAVALPLVSPLVTSRYGHFTETANESIRALSSSDTAVDSTIPEGKSEVSTPPEMTREDRVTSLASAPVASQQYEDPEDLYGVSPAGRHGDQHMRSFDEHDSGFSGFSQMTEGQYVPEDQYGHWQSEIAQFSQATSPHKNTDLNEEGPEKFQVQGTEGNHFEKNGLLDLNNELPLSNSADQHVNRYPDPDDELLVPSFNAPYNQGHSGTGVAYPELPEPDEEITYAARQSPYHSTHLMSRSQSVHSAVVNLTESDKVQEGEDGGGVPLEGEEDEQDIDVEGEGDEGSFEGSMDEEPYHREGPVQNRYLQQGDPNMEEEETPAGSQSGGEGLEPQYSDDEEDEELYDEDEEGSYDEDDYAHEEEPTQKGPPVFIDLLSSDDEDGGNELTNTSPREPPQSRERGYLQEKDGDKSEDEDQSVPPSERFDVESATFKVAETALFEVDEDERMSSEDEYLEDGLAPESEIAAPAEDPNVTRYEATDLAAEEEEDPESDHNESNYEEPEEPGALDNSHGVDAKEHESEDSHLEDHLQPVDPSSMVVDHPAQEVLESYPDIFGRRRPLDSRQSLQSQMFNLDGANDSPTEAIYPALSRGDSANTIISGFGQYFQSTTISVAPTITRNDDQLPTPDDTQSSRMREAQVSFSFTSGIESASGTLDDSSTHIPIDSEFESLLVARLEPEKEQVDKEKMDQDGLNNAEKPEAAIALVVSDLNGSSEIAGDKTVLVNDDVDAGMAISGDKDTSLKIPESSDIREADVTTPINNGTPLHADNDLVLEVDRISTPILDNEPENNEETIRVSPRRSQRIGRSSSANDSIEVAPPATPTRTRATPQQTPTKLTPLTVLDEHSTPQGHDASIDMALAALDSPTKQQHDLRRAPIVDLKIRLSRVLRTELPDYTSLKVLRYHLKERLDVLVIATTTPEEPQRAKGGPRHYQITFNITDPSIAPTGVTECQIHRPYKDALPIINAGDGILLRNFQVVSIRDKGFALRSDQNEASSWAVFKDDEEVEARGPPVEYGPAETKYFVALKEWFQSLDTTATAKLNRANASKAR